MAEKKLIAVLVVILLITLGFVNLYYQKQKEKLLPHKPSKKEFWLEKYLLYDSEIGDRYFHTEWYD
jgi:hypothetical protein